MAGKNLVIKEGNLVEPVKLSFQDGTMNYSQVLKYPESWIPTPFELSETRKRMHDERPQDQSLYFSDFWTRIGIGIGGKDGPFEGKIYIAPVIGYDEKENMYTPDMSRAVEVPKELFDGKSINHYGVGRFLSGKITGWETIGENTIDDKTHPPHEEDVKRIVPVKFPIVKGYGDEGYGQAFIRYPIPGYFLPLHMWNTLTNIEHNGVYKSKAFAHRGTNGDSNFRYRDLMKTIKYFDRPKIDETKNIRHVAESTKSIPSKKLEQLVLN